MTSSIGGTQNQSKNKDKNRNRPRDQGKVTNSAKTLWKCLERLIVIRLSDIRLNRMILERTFVKTDPENSKARANKRLVM